MRSVVALLVGALLLSACGTGTGTDSDATEFTGTRLDNPYDVADIALTDTAGSSYSLATDRDKPLTLVFFGYTNCPDFCPLVMGNLAGAWNRLSDSDRAQVDLVFVTTDPARDDAAALQDYLAGYHEDFIGLTGPLEQISALAEPLHIYVSEGEELPSGGRDLGGHTTWTVGIDESDQAVVLWKQSTSALEYAADIHALLAD